ncbi:M20 family metallopeptidase [Mesorhizobium sp. YIM 152430]|uniref:M20 aminoacylase family protein n=1 Tax=Mesorhizobium sp. YIM 152430 TaxID=3031761 RepID=UPI0023DAE3B9|nr:M20 aminoacylase family protein [Mesorhizobium sp. YIM 152430]MDF1601523.1 M20 family metallopeptidase [Mesorhizobium sp. YIM 152430]
MPTLPRIAEYADELTAIRRDFHANPEIGFEETRTAGIVAEKLKSWGIEVHTGIGKTGVVGVLQGKGGSERAVGLRADMDALPMDEETNLPWRSTAPGKFHGCGHDGHTTMLLGAARYLAETRDFSGKAVFIFQPAEEGLGGARAMLADGLFDKFPCDEIYGMHNNPMAAPNKVGVKPGPAMAGSTFFDIYVKGVGSHGAMPHHSKDPIVAVTSLVQSLQSIVSRNVPAVKPAVLSVTQIHSGSAYNVVPDKAVICGTIRYFDDEVKDLIHARIRDMCEGYSKMFGIEVKPDLREIFTVLMNDDKLSETYLEAASDIVGIDNITNENELVMGSEDFADMLKAVPGAYCTIGHGGDVPVHNPGFIFDDAILPVGASVMARIVEKRLPL